MFMSALVIQWPGFHLAQCWMVILRQPFFPDGVIRKESRFPAGRRVILLSVYVFITTVYCTYISHIQIHSDYQDKVNSLKLPRYGKFNELQKKKKNVYATWVRSSSCGCLVTLFCYQLIANPANKEAAHCNLTHIFALLRAWPHD